MVTLYSSVWVLGEKLRYISGLSSLYILDTFSHYFFKYFLSLHVLDQMVSYTLLKFRFCSVGMGSKISQIPDAWSITKHTLVFFFSIHQLLIACSVHQSTELFSRSPIFSSAPPNSTELIREGLSLQTLLFFLILLFKLQNFFLIPFLLSIPLLKFLISSTVSQVPVLL